MIHFGSPKTCSAPAPGGLWLGQQESAVTLGLLIFLLIPQKSPLEVSRLSCV